MGRSRVRHTRCCESKAREVWEARDRATHLPTVLLIDRQGVLRYELFSGDSIDEKIEKLLAGPSSSDEAPGK